MKHKKELVLGMLLLVLVLISGCQQEKALAGQAVATTYEEYADVVKDISGLVGYWQFEDNTDDTSDSGNDGFLESVAGGSYENGGKFGGKRLKLYGSYVEV